MKGLAVVARKGADEPTLDALKADLAAAQAVVDALRGKVRDRLLRELSRIGDGSGLSSREEEVYKILHLSTKEIAWRLRISRRTAAFHITSVLKKLRVTCREEWFMKAGIK